ncbi:hypothetical protein AB0I77_50990 [Streptomyces sp. NPDC050619]|uniref:hypothetical protein n=1 Tax=Streptomyces sp. NPDC050619 TaxID=3157214 RepID=UPI00343A8293
MINKRQPSADGPLVTIQSADASAAHGVLVADDIVFVPQPPARLLTAPKLNAVIRPGSAGSAPGESIAVTDVRLLGLDDGKIRASVAVITLAEPSTLRRKVPQYSAARLGEAITAHGGDLWAALGSLGYGVPVDAGREGAPESWPDFRAFAGPGETAVEMHDSIAAFANSGCLTCGCCLDLPPKAPSTDGNRRPRQ